MTNEFNFDDEKAKVANEENLTFFNKMEKAYLALNQHPGNTILAFKKKEALTLHWGINMKNLINSEPDAALAVIAKIIDRPEDAYTGNSAKYPDILNGTYKLKKAAEDFQANFIAKKEAKVPQVVQPAAPPKYERQYTVEKLIQEPEVQDYLTQRYGKPGPQ